MGVTASIIAIYLIGVLTVYCDKLNLGNAVRWPLILFRAVIASKEG